jgi:hypothetical protein
MSKGIDTAENCQAKVTEIKNAGYDFVCRYYNVNCPSKNLTLAEAKAISKAGLYIVAVWENGYPTDASYFSESKGEQDGKNAYNYAKNTIGQPYNKPIYFAVDYDASYSDVLGVVSDYFKGVAAAFKAAGGQYDIGIYGSGYACSNIMKSNSNVKYAWLAQSTGWGDYRTFTGWNIKQGDSITVAGLGCDSDVSNNNAGAFNISF